MAHRVLGYWASSTVARRSSIPRALTALGVSAIVGYLPVDALVGLVRRVAFWRVSFVVGVLAVVDGVLIL